MMSDHCGTQTTHITIEESHCKYCSELYERKERFGTCSRLKKATSHVSQDPLRKKVDDNANLANLSRILICSLIETFILMKASLFEP